MVDYEVENSINLENIAHSAVLVSEDPESQSAIALQKIIAETLKREIKSIKPNDLAVEQYDLIVTDDESLFSRKDVKENETRPVIFVGSFQRDHHSFFNAYDICYAQKPSTEEPAKAHNADENKPQILSGTADTELSEVLLTALRDKKEFDSVDSQFPDIIKKGANELQTKTSCLFKDELQRRISCLNQMKGAKRVARLHGFYDQLGMTTGYRYFFERAIEFYNLWEQIIKIKQSAEKIREICADIKGKRRPGKTVIKQLTDEYNHVVKNAYLLPHLAADGIELDFMTHRHNILELRYAQKDSAPQDNAEGTEKPAMLFIVKFSKGGTDYLPIEEQCLNTYRRVLDACKKKFLVIPRMLGSIFSDEANFLLIEKIAGRNLQEAWYELIAKSRREPGQHNEEKDKFIKCCIEKIARCDAMAYAALALNESEGKESILTAVHDPRKYRQGRKGVTLHYLTRIHHKTIEDSHDDDTYRESYGNFPGGLVALLSDREIVVKYRLDFLHNIDPILELVVNAPPGVYTDRTLRNFVGEGLVDFETLRDSPTLLDLAMFGESGPGSNQELITPDSNLEFNGAVIHKAGDTVTRNQHNLWLYANNLSMSLKDIAEAIHEKYAVKIEPKDLLKSALPNYSEDPAHTMAVYNAGAFVCDCLGFGATMRYVQVQPDPRVLPYHLLAMYHFLNEAGLNAEKVKDFYISCLSRARKDSTKESITSKIQQIDTIIQDSASICQHFIEKYGRYGTEEELYDRLQR